MAVKTVEMVRRIRDQHYKDSRDLPVEGQIRYVKEKSEQLLNSLKSRQRSTVDNMALTAKV